MRLNQQVGSLLVAALFYVTGIAALLEACLGRSMTEVFATTREASDQQAFHLAEAGVDAALRQLRTGQTEHLAPTTSSTGHHWTMIDLVEGLMYRLNAHGLAGGEQRDVEAVVRLHPRSVFQYALFGHDQVHVSGEAVTDSYDSTAAAYDPGTAGQQGDVGTNAVAPGSVTVGGGLIINGQVAIGEEEPDPTSAVRMVGGTLLITGLPPVVTQSVALSMPPVNMPSELTCAALSVTAGDTVMLASATGSYCFTDLSVAGTGVLTTDGAVTVYVTGTFSASGNARIGLPDHPPAMTMVLLSTQEATIESSLTGMTEFYGGLYAPMATLKISGSAQVFGSVIAQAIDVSGQAQVHYDTALGAAEGPIGGYDTQLLSWREP